MLWHWQPRRRWKLPGCGSREEPLSVGGRNRYREDEHSVIVHTDDMNIYVLTFWGASMRCNFSSA